MCHGKYDCAWMKCLCIRFTFMVFSFIKFANFSPVHTLRACWCSLFLFCPRRDFCLDACPSHRISFLVLGRKNHSCSSLYAWNTGFLIFSSGLHNFRVVNKFHMNKKKCNAINLIMQQNTQCICKEIGIAKDGNGLLRPNDFSFIESR